MPCCQAPVVRPAAKHLARPIQGSRASGGIIFAFRLTNNRRAAVVVDATPRRRASHAREPDADVPVHRTGLIATRRGNQMREYCPLALLIEKILGMPLNAYDEPFTGPLDPLNQVVQISRDGAQPIAQAIDSLMVKAVHFQSGGFEHRVQSAAMLYHRRFSRKRRASIRGLSPHRPHILMQISAEHDVE